MAVPDPTPTPAVALVTLMRYLWSGRIPDVHAGDPFWVRADQFGPLEAAGYIRVWVQGSDPALPPVEPASTAHGIPGVGAGTTNSSPGVSLIPPAGPPPRSQN